LKREFSEKDLGDHAERLIAWSSDAVFMTGLGLHAVRTMPQCYTRRVSESARERRPSLANSYRVVTCLRFTTSNTIRKQFYHCLLINGYVERVSRGSMD
jgi:hypothetical protein